MQGGVGLAGGESWVFLLLPKRWVGSFPWVGGGADLS